MDPVKSPSQLTETLPLRKIVITRKADIGKGCKTDSADEGIERQGNCHRNYPSCEICFPFSEKNHNSQNKALCNLLSLGLADEVKGTWTGSAGLAKHEALVGEGFSERFAFSDFVYQSMLFSEGFALRLLSEWMKDRSSTRRRLRGFW